MEIVFFIIIMLMLGASIYANVKLFIENTKYKSVLTQSILNYEIISSKLSEEISKNSIENSDGFLKFVTQSRDWAFQYIEDVQEKISKFVEVAGKRLEYFDKHGRSVPSPHTDAMEEILKEYRELISVLPEIENKQGEK